MEFENWHEYLDFKNSVLNSRRFFLEDKANIFLQKIVKASDERKKKIVKGKIFHRAQLGYASLPSTNSEIPNSFLKQPYDARRMKPSLSHSRAGRANPAGIAYLYLATTLKTALGEMRPWIGAEFSCSEFVAKRDLVVADFITNSENSSYLPKNTTHSEIKNSIFYHLNNAFSEPINQDDAPSLYVPTQIISEYFRSHGYDGIAYKSSLGDGYNLVFFDIDSFEPINCQIFKATNVDWEYAQSNKINY